MGFKSESKIIVWTNRIFESMVGHFNSVIFDENYQVSGPIGKLITEDSKTPPILNFYSKVKVLEPSKTKPEFCVTI